MEEKNWNWIAIKRSERQDASEEINKLSLS